MATVVSPSAVAIANLARLRAHGYFVRVPRNKLSSWHSPSPRHIPARARRGLTLILRQRLFMAY
ncbi:hypothetical protein BX283_7594 [Streptomyces sp. TLI_146]|nr:hypothetical protein BX283_7594 [Streptomyces sp. TLI_146]